MAHDNLERISYTLSVAIWERNSAKAANNRFLPALELRVAELQAAADKIATNYQTMRGDYP
jgi:hypothetical protein